MRRSGRPGPGVPGFPLVFCLVFCFFFNFIFFCYFFEIFFSSSGPAVPVFCRVGVGVPVSFPIGPGVPDVFSCALLSYEARVTVARDVRRSGLPRLSFPVFRF